MSDDEENIYDTSYKIILLGESGVGKTALIRTVMNKEFVADSVPTIGIDFLRKTFDVDGAKVKMEIWDTAGQERFRTITRFQYRGTKGILLMYDITNKSSFTKLKYWLDSIDKELDQQNKEPVPVFIIGNKCDLQEQRVVSTEMGEKLAESSYVHGFMETSARDGINVHNAFSRLALAVTEINHPKLLDSYLCPTERRERQSKRLSKLDEAQAPPSNTTKGVKLKSSTLPGRSKKRMKKISGKKRCKCG